MRIHRTLTTPAVLRELGDRLRGYRLQQNRRVADVAREAGVPPRSINRLESGENPTLATVIRVLRALGPRWTPQIRPLIDTAKPATTPVH